MSAHIPFKYPPNCADAVGMTNTRPTIADAALSDIERLMIRLIPDVAVRESLLCAVETYGDARADEALTADAV